MKNRAYSIAAAAVAMIAVTPCLAAQDVRDTGSSELRSAAFAGANLRMPLGTKAARPTARLQLTTIHSFEDRQSASATRTYRAPGLELGFATKRGAAMFINGQDVAQTKRKLGINGSTNTLLIIGGVIVAGAAAYLLFLDNGSNAKPAN
jgi:hypothetical protein